MFSVIDNLNVRATQFFPTLEDAEEHVDCLYDNDVDVDSIEIYDAYGERVELGQPATMLDLN